MAQTALNDTYLERTNTTALQNKVCSCQKMYNDIKTWVMVNQSVNEFHTWILFQINALP